MPAKLRIQFISGKKATIKTEVRP
uniref:Uncharacterized protein n=1 Tax=Anguilla anguilla TaxID=7936 RepID=A0A0E9UKU1_ANGAN